MEENIQYLSSQVWDTSHNKIFLNLIHFSIYFISLQLNKMSLCICNLFPLSINLKMEGCFYFLATENGKVITCITIISAIEYSFMVDEWGSYGSYIFSNLYAVLLLHSISWHSNQDGIIGLSLSTFSPTSVNICLFVKKHSDLIETKFFSLLLKIGFFFSHINPDHSPHIPSSSYTPPLLSRFTLFRSPIRRLPGF